jgi:hypothetical protein
MTIRPFVTASLASLFLLGAVSSSTAASFVDCFIINGELECFEIPLTYAKIRIPGVRPDPPPEFDIRSIAELLRDVLGRTSTTWYMGDATGEHTILIDMVAERALDLSEQAVPGM